MTEIKQSFSFNKTPAGRNGFGGLVSRLRTEKPWLPGALAERLMRLYGTKAFVVVKSAGSLADLGRVFGGDLTEAELDTLEHLSDQDDRDLLAWLTGAEPVPAEFESAIFKAIQAFHQHSGPVNL